MGQLNPFLDEHASIRSYRWDDLIIDAKPSGIEMVVIGPSESVNYDWLLYNFITY